jgi:dinuclear metal center YbgI/SA1388 family protein
MLLDLIRAGVAIYSPHTAFDSAAAGINQRLAEALGLTNIRPLIGDTGAGRMGELAADQPLAALADQLKEFLKIGGLHVVGDLHTQVQRVAVACGSAGELLAAAVRQDCDVFVTGESRLHTCYEAQSLGIDMILTGHYASERFGVEQLAGVLAQQFPSLTVWASQADVDPLQWV